MIPYLIPLQEAFEQHANVAEAEKMQAYMKGHFPFYGIKAEPRRKLLSSFLKEHGMPTPFDPEVIRSMWDAPQRELHQSALDILCKQVKQIKEQDLTLLEELITSKSWWDTVDGLASWVCGPYFLKFAENRATITGQWAVSDNMWLRRTSIIFQLGYKEKTDWDLLFRHIELNLGSKEFFINKAIGWALREYGKTEPEAVREFVSRTTLHPLSEREATRRLAL